MTTVTTKPMDGWNTLPWKKIERSVFKLQKRIYQASRRGDRRTVRKLQRLLMKSRSAKLLAVRRVTQDNQGKKTAGIDGVKSLTPPQRLQLSGTLNINSKATPVRRVWIPKPGTTEQRGLGIPTINDRALQSLAKDPDFHEPNPALIGLCGNCQAVLYVTDAGDTSQMLNCHICGEATLRPVDAREPKGFFTDLRPQDFDGSFEWTPRATRPTLNINTENLQRSRVANAEAISIPNSEILSINDNGGKGGFDFKPALVRNKPQPGAYAAIEEDEEEKHFSPVKTSGASRTVALLSRRITDTLLVRLNSFPNGIKADPRTIEGRGAWYSFAFFLRAAAAAELDVDVLELDAGFRTESENGEPVGQAFLCDKLENGAGYCRWLGQSKVFEKLLRQSDSTRTGSTAALWTGNTEGASNNHQDSCDTSCNRCLRDYYNLPYHGLLDWRLALDMTRLALSDTADLSLMANASGQLSYWSPLIDGDTAPVPAMLTRLGYKETRYFGSLRAYINHNTQRRQIVVERHPLWTDEHPVYMRALEEARRALAQYSIKHMTPFLALRRPSEYV